MDRQFTEEEAREVFARAAERQHAVGARADGLSLDELRAIGAEAGLDPEFVEAAARSVALGEPETARPSFGPIPRGVSRTVFLPDAPSDALWEQVLGDARRTFSAQGKVSGGGGVREWRNGNLRVSLEPARGGSRLHLQTRREDRVQGTVMAAVAALAGLVTLFLSTINAGFDPEAIPTSLMLIVGGALGALALGIGQRRWADERGRQMDGVIQRAAEAGEAAPPVASPNAAGRIDPSLLADDPAGLGPEADRPADRRRSR
ncbi:hypothetical protein [Rubrivirga marina]|uniref:Uncharacterized protein n=1 Tax=Rubrivirga marina TaxID=1196024 RepID=A0A271J4R1_9BACT|nr:hypothetical protein [Rubrivirga marina]PAP78340.1 hypothetical protein BSZ37_18895 [Rubrivirga marina]